ncbi:hypothetical protein FSP39_000024 [Pinctada imbricata]|uniref:PHD-type domain-containing protein n=1 Tax=Pinctada imbricata TaxID=66713 RepID=A0AA88XW92_PINIB|nr:hypothetical protein FSP39_000024 [Pinctada imbricata]
MEPSHRRRNYVSLNSQKQSKPLSADKENPTIKTCETCGHSKENYLVKLGLVSKELSEILVEPPPPPKKKGRKNTRSHEMAEAVYSKPVETEVPTEPEQDMEEAQPTAVPCEVCMTDYDIFWVGCDNCDRWYHHECLSPAARRAVDKSLSDKSVWLCHICSEE